MDEIWQKIQSSLLFKYGYSTVKQMNLCRAVPLYAQFESFNL